MMSIMLSKIEDFTQTFKSHFITKNARRLKLMNILHGLRDRNFFVLIWNCCLNVYFGFNTSCGWFQCYVSNFRETVDYRIKFVHFCIYQKLVYWKMNGNSHKRYRLCLWLAATIYKENVVNQDQLILQMLFFSEFSLPCESAVTSLENHRSRGLFRALIVFASMHIWLTVIA